MTLDDLKYIHERDAQDALGIIAKQPEQLTYRFEPAVTPQQDIHNVVLAGMGGSALAASYIPVWPGIKVPFEIVRNYDIPAYVGPHTLFIADSYSGNTEETVAALQKAEQARAQVVVIAGAGKLQDIAHANQHQLLLLPKTNQPRYAVLYNLVAMITVLQEYKLTIADNLAETLQATAQFLTTAIATWQPTIPAAQNPAKQLALEIMGKSPVVYSGPLLAPAAYKWKISFNENAKNIAWWNQYPEFNHNEFIGWTSHPTEKPYAVINLQSSFDNERITKRFAISEQLLSGQRPAAETVQAQGNSVLDQLVWASVYGDFVSVYLGLLNGVNPAPVDLVEKLKKMLG